MKILIITQVFYPDTVSVSQHISDLAFKFASEGHTVKVISSKFTYDDKTIKYKSVDVIQNVEIFRLNQTSFGKKNIMFRILDFLTFYIAISFKLIFIKKNEFDIILGSTVPPLLSFIGIIISKWKRIKFVYWVMDLQPELSISSGLIRENSITANFFTKIGNYIIRNSDKIISLDRFMTNYLISRGARKSHISTIPVWPVLDNIYLDSRMSNPFRIENNFGDKIVIMYSGNHAYVHPLDTLLQAALNLKNDPNFLFVFIGGGVRKDDVTVFKKKYQLNNIVQLPFQPRENIHYSLGSSDIQVVILGQGQVGYTHPNKVYGALYVGKPIIYIGPKESHVGDIIDELQGNIFTEHGDVTKLVDELLAFKAKDISVIEAIGINNKKYAELHYHPDVLKNKMINEVLN